jgi:hypothetical protein
MSKIDEIIEKLKYERRANGEIIDDRSMNKIPFSTYTKEYKELDRIIDVLEAERDGLCVILPCNVGDNVYVTFSGKIEEHKVHGFRLSEHLGEHIPVILRSSVNSKLQHEDIPLIRCDSKNLFLARADAISTISK